MRSHHGARVGQVRGTAVAATVGDAEVLPLGVDFEIGFKKMGCRGP